MAAFNPMLVETYTAPTNIAVIKYWGKGDLKVRVSLIFPFFLSGIKPLTNLYFPRFLLP